MSDFERLGGEAALKPLIADFVDRMFADFIIGFLFQGKDRDRIVRFETQHAARVLGAPVRYEGRALAPLHKPLRINRGQFRRRLAILRTVAREHGVPDEVIDRWLAQEARLEPVITDGTDCLPQPEAHP